MTALPPSPFCESSTATGGNQGSPTAGLPSEPSDAVGLLDFPLRDEPSPLFLTEAAPELDRELEAMLRVHFGF